MGGETAKYRKIFESLRKAIRDGQYQAGMPLPSEESIVRKFGSSRFREKEHLVLGTVNQPGTHCDLIG